jgi:hypothetical protein
VQLILQTAVFVTSLNKILQFLIITFADTIGVSEDGTFFYGSKRGKHHTYITFTVFFGYHTNEQFPF